MSILPYLIAIGVGVIGFTLYYLTDSGPQYQHGNTNDSSNNGPEPYAFEPQYDTAPRKRKKEEDCCPICMEKLANGKQLRKLMCSHQFHIACVNDWFRYDRTCPVCRKYC